MPSIPGTLYMIAFCFAGAVTGGLFILIAGYFKNPDAVIGCMCVSGTALGLVLCGLPSKHVRYSAEKRVYRHGHRERGQ